MWDCKYDALRFKAIVIWYLALQIIAEHMFTVGWEKHINIRSLPWFVSLVGNKNRRKNCELFELGRSGKNKLYKVRHFSFGELS